ncbi:glycosyltransferase [Peribacillus frigoritolerans]|nr:glycosyltransferase [Peribacillus frigoritolerans]
MDQPIESALNQAYPDIEVIVVNDGSTKFTKKITPSKRPNFENKSIFIITVQPLTLHPLRKFFKESIVYGEWMAASLCNTALDASNE